jgi:hypothetical protein
MWIRNQRKEPRMLIELRRNSFLSITKEIFGHIFFSFFLILKFLKFVVTYFPLPLFPNFTFLNLSLFHFPFSPPKLLILFSSFLSSFLFLTFLSSPSPSPHCRYLLHTNQSLNSLLYQLYILPPSFLPLFNS